MKCTNCGKNNAVYHYHFDLNGETQEAHLCAECAGKLAPEKEFAAKSRKLFGDMFDDGFFDGSLFGREPFGGNMLNGFFGGDPFESFFGGAFSPFALLGTPRIEISFPEAERSESVTGSTETAPRKAAVDPELAKKRRINELRAQMKAAAESEDYEKAAALRDQLRALEGEKGE